MNPTISFGDFNSAVQVGVNHGTINAECHFPLTRTDLGMDPDNKLPVVHSAAFGSLEDRHEDECLPGTRTNILYQIGEWVSSPEGRCIFWLNGMAGTGKSTISRTVAKSSIQAKSLGASFFFKKGEGDRGNATKLFPTIAWQLATSFPRLMPSIRQAVQDDPAIAMKGMNEQFEKLLIQPLLSLTLSDHPIQTVVIVIDALDECEGEKDIRLILQLLPQLQKPTAVRLRIFLTSRPELPIRLGFNRLLNNDYKDLVLHEIAEEVIKHDILLFLNHRLSEIRKERVPPPPHRLAWSNRLALSAPLFIFAATICRIFEDPDWDPLDSLPEILIHQNDESKLDGTYLPVLDRLLNRQNEKQKKQLVQEFHQVVGAIVLLESPLSVISLSRLIDLPERLVHLRLSPLHSVLSVPSDETLPVQLFHLSFRDFLLDPETREKTPFWVDKKEMHYRLTTRCLFVCQKLRKNICGLPSHGTQRAEIDRRIIDRYISPELQYACQYWAHHLMQCTDLHDVLHDALSFLQRHFLHWVEAMSLLSLGSEVVGIINLLNTGGGILDAMSEFLHDAKRFILKHHQMADDKPLQIYCSGLVFAPKKAIIRREFGVEIPNCITRLPQVEVTWGSELQILEGHSSWVWSVIFSPDGRLLASGSSDGTIRLWDTVTGALQETLNGHSDSVYAVAFSPNDRLLASGSSDKTIRLWDTATGALHQTLKCHSRSVCTVAFSHDGQMLASGSDDKTIRLWDTATGALQQTLEGHSGSVCAVAFSPDSRLASGSSDGTIRLWDTATGALQQTLEGHSGSVCAVAFSPDGRLLASGSSDEAIRLWDTVTGAPKQTLEGHSGSVCAVAFSPDGRLLASGSDDKTIRLWGTTGATQQTLEGHSGLVASVAFSHDGRLASGSDDKTIRLWKTTGVPQQTIECHSGSVRVVAFSPDGRLLASGSSDGTIRLWDAARGTPKQILEGHWGSVCAVAFSPDGRLLASGSSDEAIRLWDTVTGAPEETLGGHSGLVGSVAFSPDGRLLASGSDDETIRLWDTATGALQQTLEGHSGSVRSVAFSHDGRLASGSDDKTIRLWDTTGVPQQTIECHSGLVCSVAFSPDGRLLASGSDDETKTIRLWDTATGALQQTLEGHSGSVRSVAFSHDGRLLASSSDDETIRLWDTATGALQQTFEGHLVLVGSVALSPDGRLLASGSDDETIRLWDTATGALQQSLEGHSGLVGSVAFSPDGRLLASGSNDETIRLWDTATGALHQTLEGHSRSVWAVAFSPDGRLLASGSDDETIRLWDTTGAPKQTLEGHSGSVCAVAFSPDGRLLASGSDDETIRLWDTVTGTLQQTLESQSGSVCAVAFSPDGRLLAFGFDDNTIRLWGTIGAPQQTLEGHSGSVCAVAFSPDGRLLASGSDDETIRLWDTTGTLHDIFRPDGVVKDLEFSPDGLYLNTDQGSLDIRSRCGNHTLITEANLGISIQWRQWIILNGEKVLWLPREARPSCSAIKDSTLALGHESGRVSFIGFRES
ncbi:hypothetical protein N7467_012035 [Penicillium canescens]|nr:hypothetical protein N7467_012035 [Penicillium canescens]